MTKSLFRRAAAALLPAFLMGATPASALPPALPDAEPAMWVVKDADTTIYLFGTFHALDGKRDWFNDEVRQAFDSSQDVVLEVLTPDNPAELGPIVLKYALDTTGKTLTSKLSLKSQQALAATLKGYGMPANALDKYKPFFATLTLTTLQFGKLGLGPEAGAEAVLKRAATTSGKKLGSVETIDDQLGMFAALSEAEQVKLLEASLEDSATMGSEIHKMLEAWNRGDAKSVASAIQQSDKDSPALYKMMFTDRNARWVQWVDRRLASPGTVFLAVGAGHLAGDRSVVGLLRRQGHRVSRVQ